MFAFIKTRPRCACWLLLGVLALTGCSSARPPWVNAPTAALPDNTLYRLAARAPYSAQHDLTVVLSFSGGGSRAAAFAHGVLLELAATRIQWQGRTTTLLDEVDLVSGVSGGSVAAAYFVAFGAAGLHRFPEAFLYEDVELQLVSDILLPTHTWRLTSPWYGRSHVLMKQWDRLFEGMRYRDLNQRQRGPLLLISATDLSSGEAFVFTQDQFDRLCSDLADVPLAYAVAASSAVPLLLTPLLLVDHGPQCSARPTAQRYLHLVDGAMSDNLGLEALLRLSSVDDATARPPREMVLISVDAAIDPTHGLSASDRIPGSFQVIDALIHSTIERRNSDTRAALHKAAQQWLASPSGANTALSLIGLNLPELPAAGPTLALRSIPTNFSLARDDANRLIEAGRQALRQHPGYAALLQRLQARDDLPH